ncbi:MAG: T9SS type A sorting domain-containing protein, partial [Actinobacteria bacterium]|nr:T9SS type A sorting domain-containing protein [Actinomycetota bacterium]
FEYGTTLLRTTNGGADWFVQSTFDELFLHAVDFTDEARGCAGGDLGRLWWTTDGGAAWTEATVGQPEFARWPVREIKFLTASFGLASGGFYDVTGMVWRTTDGGAFWSHRRVGPEPIFGIHFFDATDALCVSGDLDFGSGMVTSTNGGEEWNYTYLGIWGQASAVSFRTPTDGWAPLGFAGSAMYTLDSGQTWDWTFTPDSTAMRDVCFPDSGTGYMVGDAGTVLKYIASPTSVSASWPTPAREALLLESRPNPFRASTQLAFRLPSAGSVSLKVYDAQGREVATLADGALAPGPHVRAFDGGRLASGVYWCRLSAGGRVETRRIVLIR